MSASLSAVTASSAIFAVVTAPDAIVKDVEPVTSPVCVAFVVLAVLAAISVLIEFASLSAVTASSCILAVVTPPFANSVVPTVPALGVPILTVDPIVMMKKSAPLAGAAENIISELEIAKPSLGWLVPLLGF